MPNSTQLRSAARFLQDARGNVAVIFGLACLTLTTGAGIAVDFSRGAHQQTALASAVDAAALAVASSGQTDQTVLEQLAADYIEKNFPDLKYPGSDIDLDIEITDNLVRLTARQVMPTTILRTVNIETMDLQAFAEVTRRASGLEVVLVLDNTGSMNSGGKLASLKTAATELTNILFGDSTVSSAVKVGVVPFSASVNVGPQYTSATWLDHTGLNPISHLHFSDATKHNSWAWLQLANMDWNGCVEQRKAGATIDYDVDDTTPTTGTPDTLFPIYFAPDEPTNSNNASSKSGWGSGFPNSYLSDWRSNESVSSTTKSNTSLSDRQRRHQKYEGTSPTGAGPAYQCKIGPITPLTGTKQTVLDAIDDMIADGGTNIASGVGWGLRVLSPTVPFTEGTAYNDEDWNKVMIVMTDGENDWGSALTNMNNSYYGGYGYTSQSLTRLGISFISNRDAVYNARTAVACDKVKAASGDPEKPIVVYTITFGSLASGAGSLMQACATDPEKYFHAPSNADLQTVFTDIATQISDLYLSQ
ncbi:MAG TPA: pilus assembly protein TadG-related protein [Aestuariivirgaceae bacterium]|jgi:Flp pilus assembly protein TadG